MFPSRWTIRKRKREIPVTAIIIFFNTEEIVIKFAI